MSEIFFENTAMERELEDYADLLDTTDHKPIKEDDLFLQETFDILPEVKEIFNISQYQNNLVDENQSIFEYYDDDESFYEDKRFIDSLEAQEENVEDEYYRELAEYERMKGININGNAKINCILPVSFLQNESKPINSFISTSKHKQVAKSVLKDGGASTSILFKLPSIKRMNEISDLSINSNFITRGQYKNHEFEKSTNVSSGCRKIENRYHIHTLVKELDKKEQANDQYLVDNKALNLNDDIGKSRHNSFRLKKSYRPVYGSSIGEQFVNKDEETSLSHRKNSQQNIKKQSIRSIEDHAQFNIDQNFILNNNENRGTPFNLSILNKIQDKSVSNHFEPKKTTSPANKECSKQDRVLYNIEHKKINIDENDNVFMEKCDIKQHALNLNTDDTFGSLETVKFSRKRYTTTKKHDKCMVNNNYTMVKAKTSLKLKNKKYYEHNYKQSIRKLNTIPNNLKICKKLIDFIFTHSSNPKNMIKEEYKSIPNYSRKAFTIFNNYGNAIDKESLKENYSLKARVARTEKENCNKSKASIIGQMSQSIEKLNQAKFIDKELRINGSEIVGISNELNQSLATKELIELYTRFLKASNVDLLGIDEHLKCS